MAQKYEIIRANNHSFSVFGGLCYYFCHPSFSTPPPIFLSSPLFVSPLPPSLSVHLNYSPCRHHPLQPPLLPPSRQSPLTLSPSLMPFLLALSLLKPVKGYQALLSISGNSIKARPYERLFSFTIQMALGCCHHPKIPLKGGGKGVGRWIEAFVLARCQGLPH